jgi:hypothetical protein
MKFVLLIAERLSVGDLFLLQCELLVSRIVRGFRGSHCRQVRRGGRPVAAAEVPLPDIPGTSATPPAIVATDHRKSAAVPTNLDELAGSLDPAR